MGKGETASWVQLIEVTQGIQSSAHPVLSDRLRLLRACSGPLSEQKRLVVSTKTERGSCRPG